MTHAEILRHYYLNANPFSSKSTVRPGYYFITEEIIESDNKKVLVKAYYHPYKQTFLPETHFIINLKPLYNYHAVTDSKGIPVEHLVNGIIKIDSINLIESSYNNQPTKSYQVSWKLLDYAALKDVLSKELESELSQNRQGNSLVQSVENHNPGSEIDPSEEEEMENELNQLVFDEHFQASDDQNEEDQLLFDQLRKKAIEREKLDEQIED